jgi:hypothetical protein
VNATVSGHNIPDYLQRRFEWLADGDSQVKQQLLNYFLLRERQQAIEITAAIVNLILPHAKSGDVVQNFRRDLQIGGHTVHVFLDPRATEVKLTPGRPRFIAPPNYSWVGGLVIVAVIIGLIWVITSNSSKKEYREPKSPTISKQRR